MGSRRGGELLVRPLARDKSQPKTASMTSLAGQERLSMGSRSSKKAVRLSLVPRRLEAHL
jgi:hypothetical protein